MNILSISTVPVIENEGGVFRYPSSEVAGQMYVYHLSPSKSLLHTRGLAEDGGVGVGISVVAAGVYQCVARNLMETDIESVSINVMSG